MNNFSKNLVVNQQVTTSLGHSKQAASISKMWCIFAVGQDSVLELRALSPKGTKSPQPPKTKHFRVKDYSTTGDCKAAFEVEALRLNELGYNVYVVMNPIRPDFNCAGSATDADIRYRDLLLIDIDKTGVKKEPASADELEAARKLAETVKRYLEHRGLTEPFVMMSGNGYHLYYVLDDVQNTEENTELIRKVLEELAEVFNNSVVSIDTGVYNASRITKVPGTIMRKGTETVDRPYRMAEVCDAL